MVLDRIFRGREELSITEGSIKGPLFYLSLPLVVTFLLQTAYNIADTFWLGRLSTEALAAISFGFPLVFLFISIGSGVAITGSVLVAQYEGSGKKERRNYAASQALAFSIVTSVAVGIIGLLIIEPLLGLMGAEPAVLPLAVDYMRVVLLGLVFLFTFFTFSALMRGWGDTITPMILMLVSVTTNIVLDPFLIFGWWFFPQLGIGGAAIATVFARAVVSIVGVYMLYSGRYGLKVSLREMKPEMRFLRRILGLGIPASLDQASRALGITATMFIIGMFPTEIVAGFGIGARVLSTVFLPAAAVAQATETLTGQNIGAGKPERAKRSGIVASKYVFLILTGLGAVTYVAAGAIANVFSPDPAVVGAAATMLKTIAFTFGAMGVMRVFNGVFRGAGNTRLAMIVTVATIWLIRLPLTYMLAIDIGSFGIWLSFAAANIAGALIAILLFYRTDWARNIADSAGPPGPRVVESLKSGLERLAGHT